MDALKDFEPIVSEHHYHGTPNRRCSQCEWRKFNGYVYMCEKTGRKRNRIKLTKGVRSPQWCPLKLVR